MKLIYIQRNTKQEKRFTEKMGILYTNVTYVKKAFLGIPLKTLHTYRKTYYGEVKSCVDCSMAS
ncbi:hypothetical protein [Cytophaga sp. FL35]|uniref:hypothetical protein n=1 Tax=Cytophaga sp. FL35 TaxID=1904456 RepID=UPI0016539724|nr:hypothetical protein [Cytophaga sp. FL35]MBC6997109.1 hypothetical protein [Cytophaga sp. FL35]